MDITSLQNPRIKHLVRLREHKRQRLADGLFTVEGFDELKIAVDSGFRPVSIITAPDLALGTLTVDAQEKLTVSRDVFQKISYRENPDGWLGVFSIPHLGLEDLKLSENPFLLIAESIEKPGNLGAMLRTADAAGVDAVIVCDPRVDLWNPNVVRASRGALFTLPAFTMETGPLLEWLRVRKIRILAAAPKGESVYTEVDLKGPTAVVFGTEDTGLSEFWLRNADECVTIPMKGRVNSLNVSIAAGLFTYEAVRQRGFTHSDGNSIQAKN